MGDGLVKQSPNLFAGNVFPPGRFLADSYFRFGALKARLRTDDFEFKDRFLRNFHDCQEQPEAWSDFPDVRLEVTSSFLGEPPVADISGLNTPSAGTVFVILFPELDLVQTEPGSLESGQRYRARSHSSSGQAFVAIRGTRITIDRELPWQMMVAHYFLTHVMSLQPDLMFFHGATSAIGEKGLLLSGDKGSGKSTLSLALAARGHGFLGDEIAAVHRITRTLLPFRRQASMRHGPQSGAVARYLRENEIENETLPDGTVRFRAQVSSMFPAATARPVEFTHAFFLGERSKSPRVERFEFSSRDLPLIAPLHATLMNAPAGGQALSFAKLFGATRCHRLSPGGSPDETADLIENIVEEKWVTA